MNRGPDSPENPFAGQGAVALDIGGDIGALVVEMPLGMVGQEVEIQPEGENLPSPGPDHDHGHGHQDGEDHEHGERFRTHVAVVRRPTADGSQIPSLVFSELVGGRYELMDKGSDDVQLVVDVAGGEVTMARWPET